MVAGDALQNRKEIFNLCSQTIDLMELALTVIKHLNHFIQGFVERNGKNFIKIGYTDLSTSLGSNRHRTQVFRALS